MHYRGDCVLTRPWRWKRRRRTTSLQRSRSVLSHHIILAGPSTSGRTRPVSCGCLAAGVVRVAAGRTRFFTRGGLSSGACRRVRCGARAVHQALRGPFQLLAAAQLPADVPVREIPVLRALSETFIKGQIMKALVIVVLLLAGCAHVPSPAELAAAAREEEECREACLAKHRACLTGVCSLGCSMPLLICTARCSPVRRAALSHPNYPVIRSRRRHHDFPAHPCLGIFVLLRVSTAELGHARIA